MPQSPASDSERMYACTHCPKRYGRKDYLERHELNHTRPQSVCPACGKGFARPDVLRKHLSTSCKSRRGSDGDAPEPLTTAEEDALVPRKRRRPQRRLTNASSPSSDEDYTSRPSKRRTTSYETYPALERLSRLSRSAQREATRGLHAGLDTSDNEDEDEVEIDNDNLSTLQHTPAAVPTPLSFAATPETLSLFKADTEWHSAPAPAAWPITPVEAPVETGVEPEAEVEGEDLFAWLFPDHKDDKVEEPPYESYLNAWEHTAKTTKPVKPAPVHAFRPDPWEDWRNSQDVGARDEVFKLFAKPPLSVPFGSLEALRSR